MNEHGIALLIAGISIVGMLVGSYELTGAAQFTILLISTGLLGASTGALTVMLVNLLLDRWQ